MKIGLVATHSFPIPYKTHTGDVVILDLAHGLRALGHDVTVFAPKGTDWPNLVAYPQAGYGQPKPSARECEDELLRWHADVLVAQDVVHDFSIEKTASRLLHLRGRPVVQTLMGGPWRLAAPPTNLCVWSTAQRERVLRGATDFENTQWPEMGGPPGAPVKDATVVWGGVDTDFYCPGDEPKGDAFLWLNRWHPAKGGLEAIAWAKRSGKKLVVAGEDPSNLLFDSERTYALRCAVATLGCVNVTIPRLPADPDHHTAKRALYRQAKALIYSVQFQEPFGLSQAEALACGTPVIATGLGSTSEIIRPEIGYAGPEWERAAESLDMACPVTACRAYAVRHFSREAFAKRYLAVYERAIAGAA